LEQLQRKSKKRGGGKQRPIITIGIINNEGYNLRRKKLNLMGGYKSGKPERQEKEEGKDISDGQRSIYNEATIYCGTEHSNELINERIND